MWYFLRYLIPTFGFAKSFIAIKVALPGPGVDDCQWPNTDVCLWPNGDKMIWPD